MDKTWIHHYTPETKRSSAEWTAAGESRDQKLNSGLARLWLPYFGTHMVLCLSTILRKLKPLIATITWHYWIDWAQKSRKNGFTCKKVFFHQDNVPCHKTMKTMVKLNKLSFEFLPQRPYSLDLAPKRLLTLCWAEKNAPGKEIWLQWRSDYRNWGLFWEQRRIILQKKHWKVTEALEWMYMVFQLEISFWIARYFGSCYNKRCHF